LIQYTNDEIRQKLRIIVFQEQVKITRLAKDCGMDAKTIEKAMNGDMTNFTKKRFEKWFHLTEVRKIVRPEIKENFTILPNGSQKETLVHNIVKMFMEKRDYVQINQISAKNLRLKTSDELKLIFYDLEYSLKWNLTKRHKALIEKYHIWLLDKWDYWQWKEKIILTLKDIPK